jgi:FkbM family methyltransferase
VFQCSARHRILLRCNNECGPSVLYRLGINEERGVGSVSLTKAIKAKLSIPARILTRSYIRYTALPGRDSAYDLYERYCRYRQAHVTARTRYGDRLRLTLPDEVCSTIYLTGEWEPVITHYIRSQLQPGDIFIDCGGYVGWYALIASPVVGPTGRVFTIEASRAQFAQIKHNCQFNGYSNVTPLHAAISDAAGVASVYTPVTSNMGHATTVESLAQREGMQIEDTVRAETLENLVGRDTLRRARIIKIDIEGSEYRALSPLFSSLSEFDTATEWLLELWAEHMPRGQTDVEAIFHAFVQAGYFVYRIPNDYTRDFWLHPPRTIDLESIDAPPKTHCDVLMSRRVLS